MLSQDLTLMNNIIHDLKTPLSSAKGFIEIVQMKGELNPDQWHYSQRALMALNRIEEMVNGLLDIAWIDSKRPLEIYETDLISLIQNTIEMFAGYAEQQQIRFAIPRARKALSIEADKRRMESAIQNLISNAIKYNKPGGEVRISLKTKRNHVHLTVEDTGKGIPSEDIPYIFDRYYRSPRDVFSHISGTGLGLAITKSVIEKHGGIITVTSEIGKGTIFTVVLPRWQSLASAMEAESESPDSEPSTLPHVESPLAPSVRLDEESLDGVNDELQEPLTAKELAADHPMEDPNLPSLD